ncbi:deaminase [Spiroplasma diminutum]|uniref:tRNA-specific adenosine deaminase n=1 Tax=Spiroplasma diminutum CUAS-1 TaxID=1276221 RepID=S5MII6_9MOLU|nr:deaminase [Spiroplasma diminutum]AGR41710.1 tRNA-specific adenosine deaminase [Spiroplasma diminutum CUAS-1]
MEDIYSTLLNELGKCEKSKDVPVSALLLNTKNEIVAKSFNSRQKKYSFTNHAEVCVLNKIYKKRKTKNLSDYILITTLKPCLMCITIIEQANIKEVRYFLENFKCNYNRIETKINFEKIGSQEQCNELEKYLKEFFLELRK